MAKNFIQTYTFVKKNKMFQLQKTIVSEEILEKQFVCNLTACKGACCIDGDAGAPLDKEETLILDEIFKNIKPILREEGVKAIEEQGTYIITDKGEYETPLINNADCAYVIYDKNIALCGIEQAYNQGLISYKKPISCHLYPIRVNQYSSFAAVNYHKWYICNDACILGKELQVSVYKFLKEPLIRKFGEAWYNQLEKIAEELKA